MKLCIIYNYAPHYRTEIFKLIDEEFDCTWYFGDSMSDVKKMDYAILKHPIIEVKTTKIGNFSFMNGIIGLLLKGYSHYLILPDTHSLSSWLFLLLSRLHPQKKVYIWTHGWYGKESRVEKILKKIMYHLPNGGAFLYGNYSRELMIKEGFNPDKLFTIHNSLAYNRQLSIRKELKSTSVYQDYFDNNDPNLFFVGRLTSVKKLDQILRAMVICKQQGRSYNMTFIGDGEKAEELKQLTYKLGLQDNVWFYGPCYNEKELSNLIYNADLCVAPGNIGLTAMHTLVFGTPALTHGNSSHQMPEFEAIKEYETGGFFEMDDIDSLATNINLWFAKNGKRREEIRQKCFKEIDEQWNPYFQIDVLKKNLR